MIDIYDVKHRTVQHIGYFNPHPDLYMLDYILSKYFNKHNKNLDLYSYVNTHIRIHFKYGMHIYIFTHGLFKIRYSNTKRIKNILNLILKLWNQHVASYTPGLWNILLKNTYPPLALMIIERTGYMCYTKLEPSIIKTSFNINISEIPYMCSSISWQGDISYACVIVEINDTKHTVLLKDDGYGSFLTKNNKNSQKIIDILKQKN